MQIECLCNPAARECIASERGDGFFEPTPDDSMQPLAAAALKNCDLEIMAAHCSIFHGASNDGAQLMHIINLLGVPTLVEAEKLTLSASSVCKKLLADLIGVLAGNAFSSAAVHASKTGVRVGSASTAAHADVACSPAGSACTSVDCSSDVACGTRISRGSADSAILVSPQQPAALDLVTFLSRRYFPIDLAHLISQMLVWDPQKRLSADSALLHPALRIQGIKRGPETSHTTSGSAQEGAAEGSEYAALLRARALPLSPVGQGGRPKLST
jgi:hypothetical protein